ncbi:MAG: D-alanyl-D-alanine carboxypeptidase family protein [Pseudomonadota bacterium]
MKWCVVKTGPSFIVKALCAVLLMSLQQFAVAAVAVPPPPEVAARGYILMDFQSGRVLAESKADERMEPASLTKIMTSYLVSKEIEAGRIKLADMVTISERAWRMEGSRSFMRVGTLVPVEVLLKGMIVQSGNDATVALAEHVAGDETVFASLMNQQANALGMTRSHFVNATGLPDPQHYTTARDVAILTRALIRDFPEEYKWHAIREFTYNNITQHNRNRLLWRNKSVDGVKTGHTESAGFCLVASAQQDGMRLISVVLGTAGDNERALESEKLLGYGFRFFETHRLYSARQPLSSVRVWKGATENLPLGLQQDLYLTIPRGTYKELKAEMRVDNPIIAPAAKGKRYGALNISLQGEALAARPLVALNEVAEGGMLQRALDAVRLWMQ